jgi:hypothetical protein
MKIDTYKGYEIGLSGTKKFVIKSGELLKGSTFATYDEAIRAIDDSERTAMKAKTANIALEVLKHDGSGVTKIKGIHLREGNLLFTDGSYSKLARESYSHAQEVYPPADWIKDRVIERVKLMTRIAEIERELRPVRIKVGRGYGGFSRPEVYDQAIATLLADYEAASKLAAEHDAPPHDLSD